MVVVFLALFTFIVGVAFAVPATKTNNTYIEVIPDTINVNGQLNLSWGIITFDLEYPDCYLAVYTNHHILRIAKIKILNPSGLNKTVLGLKVRPVGLTTNTPYFINLYCEKNSGLSNTSQKLLDVIPFYTTSKVETSIQNYVTCKDMPGADCKQWQRSVSQGYGWNRTLGVPI